MTEWYQIHLTRWSMLPLREVVSVETRSGSRVVGLLLVGACARAGLPPRRDNASGDTGRPLHTDWLRPLVNVSGLESTDFSSGSRLGARLTRV